MKFNNWKEFALFTLALTLAFTAGSVAATKVSSMINGAKTAPPAKTT